MSIRARFTLLYNLILLVTLLAFGAALYGIQAGSTLNSLKKDLIYSSDEVAINLVPMLLADPPGPGPYTSADPRTFESLSNVEVIKSLREREIVRVLNAEGELIAAPYGVAEGGLPYNAQGYTALQRGELWWESAHLNERLLILNRPVMVEGKLSMILQVARPLTERDRSMEALRNTLLAAILLTMVAAVAIGWFFSGYFLKPIQKISQTARQIGNEQNFSRRVDYQGPQDEVGQLAVTFNTMLGQLEVAYEAKARALEMQRDFVADVSHELRTPLTTLRGNLSLLSHQHAISQEDRADIQKDMVEETERMIRLVSALLEQARADSARGMVRDEVLLPVLLEEAVRQAHQMDENRQISLDVPQGLRLLTWQDGLKQVLLILLDNALKYTAGSVEVAAAAEDDRVEIQVRDHGDGIPEEKLAHIFDRFYRGERASGTGFGLGLSIAKSLVDAMGGQLDLESRLGFGSTAIISLPYEG